MTSRHARDLARVPSTAGLCLAVAAGALATPAGAQVDGRSAISDPLPLSRALERDTGTSVRTDPALDRESATIDTRPVRIDPAIGVPVRSRRRREFDTDPVPIGSVLLSAVGSATVGYDSNVYRLNRGDDDVFGVAQLSTRLRTNTARNLVEVRAVATELVYSKLGTESAFTYDVGAGGRLDLGLNDRLTLDVGRSRQVRDRSAGTEILQTYRPVRYDVTTIGAGGQKVFGRLGVNVSALAARYDFRDAETLDRVPFDQDFRDNRTYRGRVDLSYALGPGPVVYTAAQVQLVRFDQPVVNGFERNSNQYTLTAGIRGEITPLLRGQLGVGILHADAGTGPNRTGPTVEASLQYLFTELTTITFTASRAFQNVASVTTPLTLDTRVGVQVDHELRRNIILLAGLAYDSNSYSTDDGGSHRWEARAGADWLLGRHLRANARAGYRTLDGYGRLDNRNFDEATVSVGLSYQL